MNAQAYLWLSIGVMAGAAAAFFAIRLGQSLNKTSVRAKWIAIASAIGFVGVATTIYVHVGHPDTNIQNDVIVPGHTTASATPSAAGSMADVTAQLAAKLARGDGSDADWTLLQQSYAFLGDTEAAALAAQHKLAQATASTTSDNEAAPTTTTRLASDAAAYQQRVAKNPKDAAAWLGLAELQRRARDFAGAISDYEKVIGLKAMTADAWADYADAAASANGTLSNAKSRAAIDAALQLAPRHSKALWLKASLAYEERRYADALQVWQQLRAVIPDTSADAAIIDANIAEAASLASAGSVAVAASPASISGSVDIDKALKSHTAANMTLFVFAKASDSPMPVAAYRTTVSTWPVKFVLDDSKAMISNRKLSQFQQVTIEARLSQSGQALAQSGDLQTEAVLAATNTVQPIALRLNKLVP